MDRYAVLVFHDQKLTDAQQQVFSRNFGELEHTGGGNITKTPDRRLDPYKADVSNLDKDQRPLARDARTRMFNVGNRLWHSESSFRAVPAKYSLLSGRIVVDQGGQTQFADMRGGYDALDEVTKAEIEDLVCEHSLIYSRGTLGFTNLTDEERAMMRSVRQRIGPRRAVAVHRRVAGSKIPVQPQDLRQRHLDADLATDIGQRGIVRGIDRGRLGHRTVIHPHDDVALRIGVLGHRDGRAVHTDGDQRARGVESNAADGLRCNTGLASAAPACPQISAEDCSNTSTRGLNCWIGRTAKASSVPEQSNTPSRTLTEPTSTPTNADASMSGRLPLVACGAGRHAHGRQAFTPPAVRPATISFCMNSVSSSTGAVTTSAAAASGPQEICSNVSTL